MATDGENISKVRFMCYNDNSVLLKEFLEGKDIKFSDKESIICYLLRNKQHDSLRVLIEFTSIDLGSFGGIVYRIADKLNDKLLNDILNLEYHPGAKNVNFNYPLGENFSFKVANNTTTGTLKYLLSKHISSKFCLVNSDNSEVEIDDIYKHTELTVCIQAGSACYPLLRDQKENDLALKKFTSEEIIKLLTNEIADHTIKRILSHNLIKDATELLSDVIVKILNYFAKYPETVYRNKKLIKEIITSEKLSYNDLTIIKSLAAKNEYLASKINPLTMPFSSAEELFNRVDNNVMSDSE